MYALLVFLCQPVAWSQAPLSAAPQGPEDVQLPYDVPLDDAQPDTRAAADLAQLDRSLRRARAVFVAEILAIRPDPDTADQAFLATVQVEEQLKGQSAGVLEVAMPLGSGRRTGRALPIEGYRMLMFLNEADILLNSGALYLVRAEHIWRNRDDATFLDPLADREWTDGIDPSSDYIVIPMSVVREQAARLTPPPAEESPRRRWWPFSRKNATR
ncbi:MAG: hypothetical protein AAFV53_42300 [Myxococcota bacterium]